MKIEVKKLPKSQVEIDFELDEQEFANYFDKVLEHLKSHVKMDGFRKGNVPKEMVEKQVGQENLLMEAGDLAVNDSYKKFVVENKLEPIGPPDVKIIKIAKGNPFLFKVTVSVLPEITLPDYKEIVSKIKGNEVLVDEKEITEALEYLRKSRAKFSQIERVAEKKDFVEIEYSSKDINGGKEVKDGFILGDGGFMKDFEDNLLGMKTGEEKEFTAKLPENIQNKAMVQDASEAGSATSPVSGKDSNFKVKMVSVQKMELPEINDEFAKSLGMFDTLVSLKENLKEGITMEKSESERQRRRGEMLSKIAEKINIEIPEKMVEHEQIRSLEDMKHQISSQFSLTFEEYLASVKKTEEEIKKSFRLEAEKRIKNFLVLQEIGKKESVDVLPEEIAEETAKMVKNYTKEQLAKIDTDELREYSKGVILNEKIFQLLEKLSQN